MVGSGGILKLCVLSLALPSSAKVALCEQRKGQREGAGDTEEVRAGGAVRGRRSSGGHSKDGGRLRAVGIGAGEGLLP